MPFVIGQGFAEVQILRKWNWSYLLSRVEYFDEILHTHWQDLAQGIAKCHLLLVEALPRSKFGKSEPGLIFWTMWNTLKKFGICNDVDKF